MLPREFAVVSNYLLRLWTSPSIGLRRLALFARFDVAGIFDTTLGESIDEDSMKGIMLQEEHPKDNGDNATEWWVVRIGRLYGQTRIQRCVQAVVIQNRDRTCYTREKWICLLYWTQEVSFILSWTNF